VGPYPLNTRRGRSTGEAGGHPHPWNDQVRHLLRLGLLSMTNEWILDDSTLEGMSKPPRLHLCTSQLDQDAWRLRTYDTDLVFFSSLARTVSPRSFTLLSLGPLFPLLGGAIA
jgi:hypothetical protein